MNSAAEPEGIYVCLTVISAANLVAHKPPAAPNRAISRLVYGESLFKSSGSE
jgi:hypothetical protein